MRKLELQTSRLNLVIPALTEAAAALVFFETNKEQLRPTDPIVPAKFYTLEFWQKRLEKTHMEFDTDQSVRFFLEDRQKPGSFIGVTNLTQILRGPFHACYLGYSIDHRYQGKGLMFEALQQVIRYAFEEKHLHRLMANHLPERAGLRTTNPLFASSSSYRHTG
jgi:ribosomal-protein-alanine N-acetyltransferase